MLHFLRPRRSIEDFTPSRKLIPICSCFRHDIHGWHLPSVARYTTRVARWFPFFLRMGGSFRSDRIILCSLPTTTTFTLPRPAMYPPEDIFNLYRDFHKEASKSTENSPERSFRHEIMNQFSTIRRTQSVPSLRWYIRITGLLKS